MMEWKRRIGMVSGSFDPLHIGHINLMSEAGELSKTLIVVVDSDEYVATKHKVLQKQKHRTDMVYELSMVDIVIPNNRADGDCSEIIRAIRPDFFMVGYEYMKLSGGFGVTEIRTIEVLEEKACLEVGTELMSRASLNLEEPHSSQLIAAASQPQYKNPIVVVSVLLVNGPSVFLQKRTEPNGIGLLELPGGFLEPNETLEDCAKRELREEIGSFGLAVSGLKYFWSMSGKYIDGRDIMSVYFTGHSASDKVDVRGMWYKSYVPDQDFFNDLDRRALELYFRTGGK